MRREEDKEDKERRKKCIRKVELICMYVTAAFCNARRETLHPPTHANEAAFCGGGAAWH